MNWARTTATPVTTDRRVRVVNAGDAEGWAVVEWVTGSARLVGPVTDDDGDVLDDDPEFVSSARHLTLSGFALALIGLRGKAGLTAAELAEKSGVSRQSIHNLESGRHRPTWDLVQALANALGVPTDTFRDRPGKAGE